MQEERQQDIVPRRKSYGAVHAKSDTNVELGVSMKSDVDVEFTMSIGLDVRDVGMESDVSVRFAMSMGLDARDVGMEYDVSIFEDGLSELGIVLTSEQMSKFLAFYEMLMKQNQVMNLTAITEFEDVVVKHFLDSLWACKAYDFRKNVSVLDLGTGAGFPGIPLSIVFEEPNYTLVDSLQKRVLFLEEVVQTLEIKNVRLIHARAEELGKNVNFRENFDLCVSRAVANLSSLAEYCLPFVKVGGIFLSYKSESIEEELRQAEKAISVLGGKVEEVVHFHLPQTKVGRSFVVIRKEEMTPPSYPRKAGMPTKRPL